MSERPRWRRVSDRRPCVVCGRKKTCSISESGDVVWCAVEPSNRPRSSGIADGWLHFADDLRRDARAAVVERPLVRSAHQPAVLDRVYRALLATLDLSRAHAASLEARGLSLERISAGEYRTLPDRSRAREGEALARQFSDHELDGVPGLVSRHGRWTVAGAAGLLVPVRDLQGRIVALKIRLDGERLEGGRYRFLTSSGYGGAKANLSVHLSAWASFDRSRPVYVTEGELKADVSSALSGLAVLSIPGVHAWRLAVSALSSLDASRVVVAMDMDRSNPAVACAQRSLVAALRTAGVAATSARWDPQWKGLDDVLLAHRKRAVA